MRTGRAGLTMGHRPITVRHRRSPICRAAQTRRPRAGVVQRAGAVGARRAPFTVIEDEAARRRYGAGPEAPAPWFLVERARSATCRRRWTTPAAQRRRPRALASWGWEWCPGHRGPGPDWPDPGGGWVRRRHADQVGRWRRTPRWPGPSRLDRWALLMR